MAVGPAGTLFQQQGLTMPAHRWIFFLEGAWVFLVREAGIFESDALSKLDCDPRSRHLLPPPEEHRHCEVLDREAEDAAAQGSGKRGCR